MNKCYNMRIFKAFGFSILTFLNVLMSAGSDVNLLRNDGVTSAEMIGDDIFFEITDPVELSFTYRAKPAKNFGITFNDTYYKSGVLLVPVEPNDGCSFPRNAEDLEGNIALVERGQCSFLSKTVRAQEAGAIGVIITDDDVMEHAFYIEMVDDNTDRNPRIPAAFLLGINGFMIRKTLDELDMKYAVINIPLNMTFISFHEVKQPPWLIW